MNPIAIENNQANILARAIDCHSGGLSADAAKFIISLTLTKDDEGRMNELASKAREGHLTADEEAELEEFRRCGRVVEMLKLKAHKALGTK